MRRLLVILIILFTACAAPPPPATTPEPHPAAPAAEEKIIGTGRVTASSLNVRSEPSTDAPIVTQLEKGSALQLLQKNESWMKIRLADGSSGWVSARFVSTGEKAAVRKKGGCPPDSDYAFLETPTLTFSDSSAHGLVTVEATVSAAGVVTAAKTIANTTGDEALAFLTEREIKSAKFAAPVRNCSARPFIFTYKRAF